MKEKEKVNVIFLERAAENALFIEAYGSKNIFELCLLTNDLKAIHPQIRCKDYLQDLFWYHFTNQTTKMIKYGFSPNLYKQFDLKNREWYNIGIRYRTEGQDFRKLDKQLSFVEFLINQVETSFEFPLSTFRSDKSGEVMVIKFSSKWTEKPYLLSLYLLLVRLFTQECFKNEEIVINKENSIHDFVKNLPSKNVGADARNLMNSLITVNFLFDKKFPKQDWKDYLDISSVHNNSGISAFSSVLKYSKDLTSFFD